LEFTKKQTYISLLQLIDSIDYKVLILLSPISFVLGNWKIGSAIFILITILFFFEFLYNGYPLKIHFKFQTFFLLFFGLLTVFNTDSLKTGLEYYIGIVFTPICIFQIIMNSENDIIFFTRLINSMIFSGVILGFASLYYAVFTVGSFELRLPSLWSDFNIVAAYFMVLALFNFTFLIYTKNRGLKLIYLGSLMIILFGMFLTQTRGVWLATVASFLVYVLRRPKAILPTIFAFGIFFVAFFSTIQQRYLTLANFSTDGSSLGRIQAWIASVLIIKDNFLWGTGYDSFLKLRDNVLYFYIVPVEHSHNTYLRIWLEMGFFGFIGYFAFFIMALFYTFRLSKLYKNDKETMPIIDGLQLSFVGLSIAFVFDVYFSLLGTSVLIIWILISIAFKLKQKKNSI